MDKGQGHTGHLGDPGKDNRSIVHYSKDFNELERDYALMEAMLFREFPDWKLIIQTIEKFETEFNNMVD